MSIINFTYVEDNKQDVINGVWEIIKEHYFSTAIPSSRTQYEYEGKDIYLERLEELMKSELCEVDDTDDGFYIAFDSTEDAGFAIVRDVYKTGGGYNDNGLTFVNHIFTAIVKKYPDIVFDAECVCIDNWVDMECNFSYDGKTLKINDVEYEKYIKFMDNVDAYTDVEALAEEVGITAEQAYSFL